MRYFDNERHFTRWVLHEARSRGWVAGHLGNVTIRRTPAGPVAVPDKDAKGFPDVVAVHPQHGVVYAELKMPGGKPDEAQLVWLWALREAGERVYVWEPKDQDEIGDVFDGRTSRSRLFDHEAVRHG